MLPLYQPSFQQKINYLLNSLTNIQKEMDDVACEVDDINLSSAISGIASESCRYISELFSECKRFGLNVNTTVSDYFEDNQDMIYTGKLNYIVESNETKLEQAYNIILDEPHPFIHLKQIMGLQLNSLKSAFSKLKLLNISRSQEMI